MKHVEQAGTFVWAPTSNGDYYVHPELEDETAPQLPSQAPQLTSEILDRLMQLEAAFTSLPTTPANLGHNQPPDEIGLPPYTDEDAREVRATIVETRTALLDSAPDPVELSRLSTQFECLGAKIGPWLAKKGDLVVDKLIENSITALTRNGALGLLGGVAGLLRKLAQALMGG